MRPKSVQKKRSVLFDEKARREYLTGFRKRKTQRKKKATSEKLKKEKEAIREVKRKKRTELVEKLKVYGLDRDDDEQHQAVGHMYKDPDNVSASTICYSHPNHVVIVDTRPSLGPTLKSLAEDDSRAKEEGKEVELAQKYTIRKATANIHGRRTAARSNKVTL